MKSWETKKKKKKRKKLYAAAEPNASKMKRNWTLQVCYIDKYEYWKQVFFKLMEVYRTMPDRLSKKIFIAKHLITLIHQMSFSFK